MVGEYRASDDAFLSVARFTAPLNVSRMTVCRLVLSGGVDAVGIEGSLHDSNRESGRYFQKARLPGLRAPAPASLVI